MGIGTVELLIIGGLICLVVMVVLGVVLFSVVRKNK
jgi:hypothetical protein